MLVHAIPTDATYDFAADVRAGLTDPGRKNCHQNIFMTMSARRLFEVISRLPEYGLTRADERLLRRHADEIVDRLPGRWRSRNWAVAAARRPRWLLEAFCRRQRTLIIPWKFRARRWSCANGN